LTVQDGESASVAAEYQQVWIPMPDGAIFAGRLWLPPDLAEAKVPVVLEWIPYRQSDLTVVADSMLHGWFAQHGIAALRVDLRGSGNSDGTLHDEYTSQEQDDAVATIAWAAAQPWCNGSVGMIGISWSGFAALQVAARRPPALKAIITCCSTDNRYTDDVHHMGGCLLTDGLQWGTGFFNQIARPPDPAHAGSRWREMWHARLAALEPPLTTWLAHPEYDAYWKHGSVCEDYAAIACPVFAVGGWTDGYSDAVLRLMANLSVPRKALIGPWTHVYPTWGTPGPQIGFLQECLRWWRQWLVGDDTAVMQEPMLRLWMGEHLRPMATGPAIGGEWFTLPGWPVESPVRQFHLNAAHHTLESFASSAQHPPSAIETPQHCGLFAGEWCPLDGGGDAPEFQADQRQDDALSLTFDSAVLETALQVTGKPEFCATLSLQSDKSLLAARLCEVAPDGTSARVTFGLLRVHRPRECAPGERFSISLSLKAVAYRFSPGCRVRLALSTAYWPMAWAEPEPGGLKLWTKGAVLSLPTLPARARFQPPAFEGPRSAAPIAHEVLDPGSNSRNIVWDAKSGEAQLQIRTRRRTLRLGGLTFGGSSEETASILPDQAASARVVMRRSQFMSRPGWSIRLSSTTEFSWSDGALRMNVSFDAFEGDELVCHKAWDRRFPW
jgi:putative CocE/NonD family hydrolase